MLSISSGLNAMLEPWLPEQRLFLKSERGTHFVRLKPLTKAFFLFVLAGFVSWSFFSTAYFVIHTISADNSRTRAAYEQNAFFDRLNTLSAERDAHRTTAEQAQDRFSMAMEQVADMQVRLFEAEQRNRELETAVDVIQATLRTTIQERDAARTEVADLTFELNPNQDIETSATRERDLLRTLTVLAQGLQDTTEERDDGAVLVAEATDRIDLLTFESQLLQERQERVFSQIEDAVAMSMEPLDDMFRSAGLSMDNLIQSVRSTYSGQGGPLFPVSVSTSGDDPDPMVYRANEVITALDEMNLRRIAAESLPFSIPVSGNYRHTSGFGYRRDPINGGRRLHAGTDFAGARGTDIVAGGSGTVIFAGRRGGYGLMVEIQHSHGYTTRYAHLSSIRVNTGQRVTRGQWIGDLGSTGRSTGPHLHYEVRLHGDPVDPMTFIRAGRNVF
jgi:murein DD-endopeptidase MepM/ murein hydrolase activator NlpD